LSPFRVVVVILLSVGVVAAVLIGRLPPQNSPFGGLDLEQPIGFATRMKLASLRTSPEACREAIARSSLVVTALPDRSDGAFCGFRDVVAVQRSSVAWSGPVRATCAMAAALYVWEREVVAPAAAKHLGSEVRRIEHIGAYACRRIEGSGTGRPSQHATGNAIDVAGFRLADGRRISVARDWSGDPAERAFLRAVRDDSCRLFRAVLSPDYNAAHADHFHLDMGPYTICR